MKRFLFVVATLGLSCLLLLSLFLRVWNPLLVNPQSIPNQEFRIAKGSPLAEVAEQLQQKQIIVSALGFIWYAKLHGLDSQIKHGRYQFEGELTGVEVLKQLVDGRVKHNRFTIVEGWRFNDLKKNLLQAEQLISHDLNQSDQWIAQQVGIQEGFLDGAFLAETYFYEDGASAIKLLKKAHQHLLQSYWEIEIKLKDYAYLSSLTEVVSLAAIIEKETSQVQERAVVSSVFHNRLQKNMLLQSDPTVIYAIGDDYQGDITYQHLRQKHPFNTYTTKGLPPFPIAYVGRSALQAASNPATTNYLYFVARGDGSHAFSETLAEHQQAVKKYILGQSE